MPSATHEHLVDLALAWLARERGCSLVAREVHAAIPRWRIDAVGVHVDTACDTLWPGAIDEARRVVFVEAKVSVADLRRDLDDPARLARRHRAVRSARAGLDRTLAVAAAGHNARGHDAPGHGAAGLWCNGAIDDLLASRERVLRDRLTHGTKCAWLARYRMADELWLILPSGLVDARRLPGTWGVLEDRDGDVRIARAATPLACPQSRREVVRRAATRRARRSPAGATTG
jgi:hypothetical protein